jgi:hypothetical protein
MSHIFLKSLRTASMNQGAKSFDILQTRPNKTTDIYARSELIFASILVNWLDIIFNFCVIYVRQFVLCNDFVKITSNLQAYNWFDTLVCEGVALGLLLWRKNMHWECVERVVRGILGSKTGGVAGSSTELRNENHHHLRNASIIQETKTKTMTWKRQQQEWKRWEMLKMLIEKPKGKRLLERIKSINVNLKEI